MNSQELGNAELIFEKDFICIKFEDGLICNYYWGGDKSWFLNGKRHREDGPAIESRNGGKHWYRNGKLHSEDGPAIESRNGDKHWYLNSKKLSHSEWKLRKSFGFKNPTQL